MVLLRFVVVGAGIVGTLIARELSRYDVDVTVVEKFPDVGWGITKANSGIVHAGYDDEPGTMRAMFCAPGNELYTKLSKELDFPFKRTGSLVLAFNEDELEVLKILQKRGERNEVKGLEIIERDRVFSLVPNVNPKVKYALYAPSAGVIFPWDVTISAYENAVSNGVNFIFEEEVKDFVIKNGRIKGVITDKRELKADVVINASGLFGDEISKIAGAEYVPIHPRKGEYILLDSVFSHLTDKVLFPTPTEKSKGILVVPTISGEILLGPTAVDLPQEMKEDLSTTKEGLMEVKNGALRLVKGIDFSKVIRTFAGLRPESPQKDFFIKASEKVKGFVNVIAIRSPGLTAAPAIAEYVVEKIIQEDMKIPLYKRSNFNPIRKRIVHYADLPVDEWNKIIDKDPLVGNIVCYCNQVNEREVIESIRRGATTLDGIKFRTRAMAGRCQANFCTVKIFKILARELGVDPLKIRLKTGVSFLVSGKVRE